MRFTRCVFSSLFLLAAAAPSAVFAQTETGRLTGCASAAGGSPAPVKGNDVPSGLMVCGFVVGGKEHTLTILPGAQRQLVPPLNGSVVSIVVSKKTEGGTGDGSLDYTASSIRTVGQTPGAAAAQRPPASAPSATPPPLDRERTRKVHNPAADAKTCVQLTGTGKSKTLVGSGWQVTNNCGVPVEAFWCIVNASGQCKGAGTWTVRPGGTWPIQEEGNIRWGACKGRSGGGFDNGSNGEKYTCHLLSWN